MNYPVMIPDPEWLYMCSTLSTYRTPHLAALARTGIVPDAATMLYILQELNGILVLGNESMMRFYWWVQEYRSVQLQRGW